MNKLLSLALASLAVGCATDPAADTATSDVRVTSNDLVEPAYVNGVRCQIVFQGALTPQTQMYQIWAVGTRGLVNTTYNTPGRPNIYAVFGTGAAAVDNHHVDGYSQFDHYHVLENARGTDVDNRTWDLLAFMPGPKFNAATYVTARSAPELFAQAAAGVLAGPLTTGDLGFPPAVLYFPVNCPHRY